MLEKQIDDAIKYLEEEEDIHLHNYQQKDPEGLGDTVERVLQRFGITEESIKKAFGLSGCGCQKRKQFLNRIFPYRKKTK